MTRQIKSADWDGVAEALEVDAMRPIRYAKCLRYLKDMDARARILEVGCGEGSGLWWLRELGYRNLVGVEVSSERLRRAKSKLGDDACLVLISPAQKNLPFKDRSFDGVVCAAVIEHVIDPRAFVAEIARVTKPGGYVVISSDCFSWRILQVLGIYRSVQPIDRAIFPTKLMRYFSESGLRLLHCEGFSLPGEEWRFLRLLVGHFHGRVRRMLGSIIPRGLRPLFSRRQILHIPTSQEMVHESIPRKLIMDPWEPRHWVFRLPWLLFSDENVFFLVKK